jgi:hypothetical protein
LVAPKDLGAPSASLEQAADFALETAISRFGVDPLVFKAREVMASLTPDGSLEETVKRT